MLEGRNLKNDRRNVYSMELGEIHKGEDFVENVTFNDKIVKVTSSCSCTTTTVKDFILELHPKTKKTGSFSPTIAVTTEKGLTVYINVKYKVI